jgi:hypothetical protein
MATTMNSHHSHHLTSPRTLTQKVCIGMGIFFVVAGLGGIIMPGMLGMHLSLLHNLIHLASGALALVCGYADDPKKAYNFSIGFGAVYGILGVAGFVFGEPGYPGVGHMEADENLLRVIPNALEFGSADHTIHIIIAAVFLLTAYAWKKKNADTGKTVVDVQGRTGRFTSSDVFRTATSQDDVDLLNSERNLKDADLGRSDVNRRSDINRREDFERRV